MGPVPARGGARLLNLLPERDVLPSLLPARPRAALRAPRRRGDPFHLGPAMGELDAAWSGCRATAGHRQAGLPGTIRSRRASRLPGEHGLPPQRARPRRSPGCMRLPHPGRPKRTAQHHGDASGGPVGTGGPSGAGMLGCIPGRRAGARAVIQPRALCRGGRCVWGQPHAHRFAAGGRSGACGAGCMEGSRGSRAAGSIAEVGGRGAWGAMWSMQSQSGVRARGGGVGHV
mmetsp:Transcript_27363/g.88381  ORF Transcript_27363/g.88381 Transcript_27363/m.88381 type:complete len:230 (-) Transcript_27363:42-731(-)